MLISLFRDHILKNKNLLLSGKYDRQTDNSRKVLAGWYKNADTFSPEGEQASFHTLSFKINLSLL